MKRSKSFYNLALIAGVVGFFGIETTLAEATESAEKPKFAQLILTGLEKPKDGWSRLNHKVYHLDYPSCMRLSAGIDEDDDVTKSPTVAFFRDGCKGTSGLRNDFDANLSDNFRNRPLSSVSLFEPVDERTITLNGQDARLFTRTDTRDGGAKMWWSLFIKCGVDIAGVTYAAEPGAESRARIQKKDYSLPDEFVPIAASFRCVEKKK